MNTFWLKAAGGVVIVVILFIVVNMFKSSSSKQKPPEQRTISDQFAEDDKKLRAEPNANEIRQAVAPKTSERYEPNVADFKELSEEEKVDAEKLFEMAMFHKKEARLPGIGSGNKLMVDYCRQIIQKYPDSEYAFKARRMLGTLPARFKQQYNVTEEEINPQKK
ncbi:MAG: hypothetical protein NTW55_00895 [Planctomycetota bacterium]|nr:hypothetical protein [Planctomycetota bacterium]